MSELNLSIHDAPAALVGKDNQRYYLFKDENFIGRNENSLICLKDKQISRKHCIIEKSKDNKFSIRDVSVHGTFVNNVALVKQEGRELHHRDEISFSDSKSYTFVFFYNKKYVSHDASEDLNFRLKEERLSLDNSHLHEMKKLNQEMSYMKTKRSALEEEINTRLVVQENLLKQEQENLSNLINKQSTKEEKDHVERKLKDMEKKHKSEIEKMEHEIKMKMNNIVQKEQELHKLKHAMELRHKMEINELEERCKAKVEELKGKLAMSEKEHWRLLGETREVEQKWQETKQILHECEMEHARISKEREEVETKLESKIRDLAEESTSKDELMKDYQKQLQKKEEDEVKQKKEIEDLEEDLQCSICAEIFIETAVLNCGHMFCKTCIEEWKIKKKICPMCRTKITSTVRVLNIDSIIEKNVAMMSKEAKERREMIIKERKDNHESTLPVKKRKKNHSARITMQHRHLHSMGSPVLPLHLNNVVESFLTSNSRGLRNAYFEDELLNFSNLDDFEQGDPFSLRRRDDEERLLTRLETLTANNTIDLSYNNLMDHQELPVTVAAIDLTNNPIVPEIPRPRTRNITSTFVNNTIDLTTP